MTDHGENQDQAQPEYARELAELLNLLDDVDRQITPEHVARRSRELLGAPGNDVPPVPTASGGDLEHFGIAFESHLHGLADSLMSPALREAASARAVARRQFEAACRRAEAMQDTALAKAARIEAAAREEAARILDEARTAAAQVEAAARTQAEEIKAAARTDPGGRGDHLFLCTVADRLKAMADLAAVGKLSGSVTDGSICVADRASPGESADPLRTYQFGYLRSGQVRWQHRAESYGAEIYGARWDAGELEVPFHARYAAWNGLILIIYVENFLPADDWRLAADVPGVSEGSLCSHGRAGHYGVRWKISHVFAGLAKWPAAVPQVLQATASPGAHLPAAARYLEPVIADLAEMPTEAADLGIVLLPY